MTVWQAEATFAGAGHVRTTPTVSSAPATGSEAMIVRDKIKDRLAALPFFSTFHFFTNKNVQIQPESIPFAAVYFVDETLSPDGDANVGDVRFRSSVTYGISVIVQNNDAVAAENTLDQAYREIGKLYTDQTLSNFLNAPAIQAFTRGNRTHQFGAIGQDNAIPIAELRFSLVCDLGILYYDPVITDDFLTMHVKTQFPGGDSQADIDNRQQVEVEYDIPQN